MADVGDDSQSDVSCPPTPRELELEAQTQFIISSFDDALDPFEYYHWPTYGLPPRVHRTLYNVHRNGECIDQITVVVINEIAAMFRTCVNHRAGEPKKFKLPHNWKERRREIEAHWPKRKLLLRQLRARLPLHLDMDIRLRCIDNPIMTSPYDV